SKKSKEWDSKIDLDEMLKNTYDKETIDEKDEQVYTDGKSFAEATGVKAENNAKDYADEQDLIMKDESETYADLQAQEALEQAKVYAVAKDIYDSEMARVTADIKDRAPINYVDGKLAVVDDRLSDFDIQIDKKADGDTVYTIEDVDNMINNTVSKTQYRTDINGIVSDIETHGTRIGQNTEAIGLKADESKVNALENSLNTKIGDVEVKADRVGISVNEVKADLDALEIGGRNYIQNGLTSKSDLWYFTEQNKSGSYQIKDGYLSITNDNNGWKQWQLYSHKGAVALDKLEADTDYTISFEGRRSENASGAIMFVMRYSTDGGTSNQITISKNVTELGTDWTRLSKTEKISSEILKDYKFVRVIAFYTGNGTVDFRKMNLVQGNKAPRDWTPAPEDTDEAINNVSGRVESLNGEIETIAGQVKLKANQTIVDSIDKRVEIAEG